MAPRTRATSAEAAEQDAEAACLLLDLSHDEVDVVARELCDPLRPLIAVHLSSTAKGLRVPMRAALLELKQQHEEASAFAACWGWTTATLRATTVVALGAEYGRLISLGHWRTLGLLAQTRALPLLEDLTVGSDDNGDEGVTSLAAGLCGGCLPSLTVLYLYDARISLQGVSALAPALTARALPSLHTLNLSRNSIGDAELAVLAAPLRQLAGLAKLLLFECHVGDQGVAALFAQPLSGAYASLEHLDLDDNEIGNAGCVALANAITAGLPAFKRLGPFEGRPSLRGNPASRQAKEAVRDALWARSDSGEQEEYDIGGD